MSELKAAMKGLTVKQRRFVMDGCIHGDFTLATVNALIRKGLFYIEPHTPNKQWGFARLTPLGEALRANLSEIPQ